MLSEGYNGCQLELESEVVSVLLSVITLASPSVIDVNWTKERK